MKFSKYVVSLVALGSLFLVACSDSGSDGPVDLGGPDQDPPPDMQTTWSVVGTIELPVGETASNLKVWALESVVQKQLVSNVALLTPTGTPSAMATFQLDIDVSAVATNSSTIVDLYVFEDVNDNNNRDAGELARLLIPADVTCAIWANGETYSTLATFMYRLAGSTNTPVTSWYYPNCDQEINCLNRITTTNNMLTGAKLTYDTAFQL